MDSFGRYELRGVLGEGGFATVYRAWDPALGREIALKALFPHLAANPEMRRRFVAEAGALARLRHLNIVTVFDVGEADGRPFFTMELIEGHTLSSMVAAGRWLSLASAAGIIAALAKAIDYLHGLKIVHRDIKADNVMVDPSGRVVLMDFGIARMLGQTQHTRTGMVLGSIESMAPEQVRGQPVGPPADIYALGVLAYQLLSGRPPFVGDTAAVLYGHAHQPPPPLRDARPGLPEPVYHMIDAALAKDPAGRPPSGAALSQPLIAAISAPQPEAVPLEGPSDPCPDCGGQGSWMQGGGLGVRRVTCRLCRGSGRVSPRDAQPGRPATRNTRLPQRAKERRPATDGRQPRRLNPAAIAFGAVVLVSVVFAIAAAHSRDRSDQPSPASATARRVVSASTPPKTPEPLSAPSFTVNTLPVGCHESPNASAGIDNMLPAGTIQNMDLVSKQADGTWEHDGDRLCWTRLSPCPLSGYPSFVGAVDAATKVPHQPGEAILMDGLADPARTVLRPNGSGRFEQGAYRVSYGESGTVSGNYSSVSVSLDVAIVDDSDGHGLLAVNCRNGAYELSIAPSSGQWLIESFGPADPNQWAHTIAGGRSVPMTRDGSLNHVEFSCAGGVISASVDRSPLASVADNNYQWSGAVGFSVFAAPLTLRLQNLVVTQR